MNGKSQMRRQFILACAVSAIIAGQPTGPVSAQTSQAHAQAAAKRTPEDPKLVWTPSSVALTARELAPGVFAIYPDDAQAKNAAGIPAATSGGFIVGDKGVLLVDTMINRELARQLLALVRERTDKPILYAVNTSYHGDHSYGNQFLPQGVKVVQHANTQTYIREKFADDVAFMSQYFGSNQGLGELKPQPADLLLEDGAELDIDLGGKRVRVMHLGFAQTNGDLFVWLPDQKVFFTGNPILTHGPSVPWLLDGNLDQALATLKKVRATLPESTVVVPGHGVPTDVASIDRYVTYLEELKREATAAVAAELDERQAAERIGQRMQARYGAYRIYPWVHTQLNATKAYQEIKAAR